MDVASIALGLGIGLLVGSVAVWIVNDFWHGFAQKQNQDWSAFCQEQNVTWANRCFELIGSDRRIPTSSSSEATHE